VGSGGATCWNKIRPVGLLSHFRARFRKVKANAMSQIFEFDEDPNLYHERAIKLRDWAAEILDESLRARLRNVADGYDQLAEYGARRKRRGIAAALSLVRPNSSQ
jgi:hypothetical protein